MRKLAILVLTLTFWGCLSPALSAGAAEAKSAIGDSTAGRKVVVYYFYFTPRCETCLNMEAYAKEAVETGFAKELRQGRVEWHSYDTGKAKYKHYWDDFKLETKSLVMVDIMDGKMVRWKNCDQIWDLVGAKPTFLSYVQQEVRSYLDGDPSRPDSTAAGHE